MPTATSGPVVVDVSHLDELLREVVHVIRRRGRGILADYDITQPQFNALLVISNHGPVTMGQLCDHLYLACSTATDLIDRMERNELIERERDSRDRRVIRLRMQPRGQQVIDSVMAARRSYLTGVLGNVAPDEQQRFVEALERLLDLMQDRP